MKLPEQTKLEIQSFVYFLFKGTIDSRLIRTDFDYLDKLLGNEDLLYNCFGIFAHASQSTNNGSPATQVSDYILALHGKFEMDTSKTAEVARKFNKESINYWGDFLLLAKWFCYNSFPDPLKEDYIKGLKGNGTDAAPVFAVWTNVVEIDKDLKVINSEKALRRANERIKLWDDSSSGGFEEWELKQEIY